MLPTFRRRSPPQPKAARDSAGTDPRTARHLRLQAYRLEALARQAVRVPIPVLVAASFVAATVAGFVPWPRIAMWIAALCAVLLARWLFSRHAQRAAQPNVVRALHGMTGLSAVNGLVTGSGALLFLPALPPERQALLTMILVCWSAGAVSANAAYARAFLAYSMPMLGLLALHWATVAAPGGKWIALLVLLFLVIQGGFVRDNERIFRRSFAIRYRNEYLVAKLRQERQTVMHERDRAEEANRAKSRFLAHASHDLRQPLAAIAINSDLLVRRGPDPDTRELAHEMADSIEWLARLLDRLLHLSNLEAGTMKPEPMQFVLGRLLGRLGNRFRSLAADKGLAFELEIREQSVVNTDALLLEDALSNLIHNAIKYTSAGTVRVCAREEGGSAIIEVTDTGPGIPESERERIFEPLYQLSNPARDRSRGVGLGLANVREVVRLLNIGMSLDSAVGRGSTFRLVLPLADSASPSAVPAVADHEELAVPPALRALVVDDEERIRNGLRKLLEDWRLEVEVAEDYERASQALSARQFDVLITDYRLPAGRTGIELVELGRQGNRRLAAVLVSGDTADERKREATAAGLMLIEKPVSAATLQRHVARAVQVAQHEGEEP
jgi:signal transduction histidine kinase/CheY-like chemotaxis protein